MQSPSNHVAPKHDAGLYFSGNPYEKENLLMGDRYADYVLEWCDKGRHFLELGIGFGRTIERLSKHFPQMTVIDAEPLLIEKFQPRYPNVTFVHNFFEDYQTTEKFSVIGMGFVIDLVKDPLALLRRYADLLEPRGKMFVCVENASSLHRRIAHEAGLLPNIKQMSSHNHGYGHQCYNTHDEWLAIFTKAGLRTTGAFGLALKPFSTRQLESLGLSDDIYAAMSRVAKDFPAISNACFYILEI